MVGSNLTSLRVFRETCESKEGESNLWVEEVQHSKVTGRWRRLVLGSNTGTHCRVQATNPESSKSGGEEREDLGAVSLDGNHG